LILLDSLLQEIALTLPYTEIDNEIQTTIIQTAATVYRAKRWFRLYTCPFSSRGSCEPQKTQNFG